MRNLSRATFLVAVIGVLALAASPSLASMGTVPPSLASMGAATRQLSSPAAMGSPAGRKGIAPNDAALIANVREAWEDAINTRDVDALLDLYAPGAVILPALAPVRLGARAIARWHGRWSADAEVHYALKAEVVRIEHDQALEEWTADVTVTPRGGGAMGISGDPLQFQQHGVRVYRKDERGNWRIDRETWSPDHPTAARFAAHATGPCGVTLC